MTERQTAASSAVVAVTGSESESVSESLTMATTTATDIAPIRSCLIVTPTARDIILLIKGKNIGGNFVNVEQQNIGNIHYQQFLDMIVRNTSSDRYDQHPQAIHNIMETIHTNGGRFIQPYNYNKNKNNDDADDDDDANTTDRGVAAALWCTIVDRDVIKNEILDALQNSRMKHNHRISGAGVLPAVTMVGTTTAAITGAGGRGGTSSSTSLSPPLPSMYTATATTTTITGGAGGGGNYGVSITSGCHSLKGEESTGTGTISVGATTMVDNGEGGQGSAEDNSLQEDESSVHLGCVDTDAVASASSVAITQQVDNTHHSLHQNLTTNHRTTNTVATTAAAAATTTATTTEATAVLVAADAAADTNNKRKHYEDNQTDTDNKSKHIRTVVGQDDMQSCATSPSMNDHTHSLATTSIKTTVPETDTPNSNDLANTTTTITATAATMDGDKEDHTKNHGDDDHNGNSYDEEGNNPGANVRIGNAVDDGKIGRNNGKSKTTQTVDCGHPEEDQDIANNEFPRDDEEDLDETLVGDVDGNEETNDDESIDDYDYEYDDDDNEREQNLVERNHVDDNLEEDERYVLVPGNNDAVAIINSLDYDRAGAVEVRLLEPPLNPPLQRDIVAEFIGRHRVNNKKRHQAKKDKAAKKKKGGYAFKSRKKHCQEGGTIATAKTGEEARTCLADAVYTLIISLIPTMKSGLSLETVRSYFDMSGRTKTDPNLFMAEIFCKGKGINLVHQRGLSKSPKNLFNAPRGVYLLLLKIILDDENEAFHYVTYDAIKKEIYDNDRNTEIIVIDECDLNSNRSAAKAFLPLCPKAKEIWLSSVHLGCGDTDDAVSTSSVAITQQVVHNSRTRLGAITHPRADAHHALHQNLIKTHRTTTTVATAASTTTTTTTTEATAVLVAADAADANNKRKHCEDNQTDTDNQSKRICTAVDPGDMRTCAVCGVRSCLFSEIQRKKEAAVAKCFDCAKEYHKEHQAERKRRKKHKQPMAAVKRSATNELDKEEEKEKLDRKKATKKARRKRQVENRKGREKKAKAQKKQALEARTTTTNEDTEAKAQETTAAAQAAAAHIVSSKIAIGIYNTTTNSNDGGIKKDSIRKKLRNDKIA